MDKFFSKSMILLALSILLYGLISPNPAKAGVFTLPHFISPGSFGIGVEPEFIMNDGASLGVNLRYTHGVSELNNLTGIIGTGGNNRKFRLGGAFTFDFFPDVEGQPGIGLALQGLYVRLADAGSVETTAIPYIHKRLKSSHYDLEPYFAVPTGLSLSSGRYQTLVSLVLGSLFHHDEHLSSGMELGISLNNAVTYISGGVTYYY